jgi:hypothetical protein
MTIYFSVAGGVVISVILPLIKALLPVPGSRALGRRIWPRIRPYVATGLFSLIVAVLVVAAMGDKLATPAQALIAGYMWDSTLQKLTTGNTAIGAATEKMGVAE